MKRGALSNIPMPRVHLDWRVCFVDPRHGAWWRPHAWKALELMAGRVPLFPGIRWGMARMLRPKANMPQWLNMHLHNYQFDVVVVGPKPLWRAVRDAAEDGNLWIGDVYGFGGWNDYYIVARAERALVEFITPRGVAVPGGLGVPQRPYEGWGHRPARWY